MENRRFHRVKFVTQCDMMHQGLTYRGRLENISLGGALISAGECIMVPKGDVCNLAILLESAAPLVMRVEIIHSFFSMVGVRFLSFEADAERRLFDLLETKTQDPDKLRQEWQEIVAHREEG